MLFLTLVVFCAGVLATFARGTWLGRVLHEELVEKPARLLNGSALNVLARIVAVAVVLGFALAVPELAVLFGFADLALVMEVAAFVMLSASVVRLKAGGATVRKTLGRIARELGSVPRASTRGRTHARRPRKPKPAKDADGPAGWSHAWA